ncbi:MAG: hypothetical protein AAGJ10_19090 [Bacteroidota bacterium]
MPESHPRLDRSAFSITSFAKAEADDRTYWRSLTPQQRIEALEAMRQLNYAYDPASDRIQRTLEVITRA